MNQAYCDRLDGWGRDLAKKRVASIRLELVKKSRESMFAAIQTYNNPSAQFRSESFLVLMVIAWTYLLHAYYRGENIDYRVLDTDPKSRRKYKRTRRDAIMYWGLEDCLKAPNCPLDQDTKNNLVFLIGLRHEVEHEMSRNLDNALSARYQACALNYCHYIRRLFGDEYAIEDQLAYSIQFSQLLPEQILATDDDVELSSSLKSYIADFDNSLDEDAFNSERFAYRLIFFRKTRNNRGGADHVIEFIDPDSEMGQELAATYLSLKEVERPKYIPSQIVAQMQQDGYPRFNMYHHTQLWQAHDAKNPGKGYGTLVAKKYWHWYERWIDVVRLHCEDNRELYE